MGSYRVAATLRALATSFRSNYNLRQLKKKPHRVPHHQSNVLSQEFYEELERQKMDALAEFAAGAGHEINNPLAIISGHAQMLLREIEHPEHRRQLAVIVAQVQRAYEMMADIRYFARPPAPEWQKFDLIEHLNILVTEQMPLMREANVDFCFATEIDFLEIESDMAQLHLAVSVPRENGDKTNATIQLSAEKIADRVEISVEDSGPGVAAEVRPLIFCPYYSGRQAGRGLGFGLPKAWRIMQQLGGAIRYEKSLILGGARFVLEHPTTR